jgi:hypothetical protein
MNVDWEAIRVLFAAISAAGGATNVARWFSDRTEGTSEEQLPELQAEALSQIERARLKAMASPLPHAAQNIPVGTLSIFDELKTEADKIRDSIGKTISSPGYRPADRRDRLKNLNRDYCTLIASFVDNVPEATLTDEIKNEWRNCQAKFPDLSS